MLVAAVIVLALVVILQFYLLLLVLRQQGRILQEQDFMRGQVDDLEQHVFRPAQPEGLRVLDPAPEFDLPTATGETRSLADYRGRQAMLVFWDPSCTYCNELAPRLRDLPESAPAVVLVSRGDAATNLEMARANGWRNVDILLEEGWRLGESYKANGTPMAYVIDGSGQIASPLTTGPDAIFELATAAAEGRSLDTLPAPGGAVSERAENVRQGLPPGTEAPNFRLSDLTGREQELVDYRGDRVLLVLSDPDCGPCNVLAPDLEQIHLANQRNGLRVVMVSRGDVAFNRQKVRQYKLTFPVLLQRQWEVSQAYGMYTTPVGYLVDERGILASGAAVGADAILALVPERVETVSQS